jgi:hypothetical protein
MEADKRTFPAYKICEEAQGLWPSKMEETKSFHIDDITSIVADVRNIHSRLRAKQIGVSSLTISGATSIGATTAENTPLFQTEAVA